MERLKILEEINMHKSFKLGRAYREEGRSDLAIKEFEKNYSSISCKDSPFLSNMVLNEVEIVKGKKIIESKPRGMGIALTNRCNIRCIMCSVWQNPWDIPRETIEEIMGLLPYFQRIFWQGGEVFLSPYFDELLEGISSYPHIRQDINTNGLLINRNWAKRLVRANANIIFSIDGVTKETYEYIRRGAKFGDLLKSIEIFNEEMGDAQKDAAYTGNSRKCSTIINLVVMKSNYHELGGFIDFAKKYRFDRLQITPVDIDNQENIFLHKDQEALSYIDKIMPEIFEKAKTYGICVSNWLPVIKNISCPQKDIATSEKTRAGNHHEASDSAVETHNNIACYWPWQFLFIDWGGRVRPQCFCPKPVGNIHDNTIAEIWNGQIIQSYREKLFENGCQNWCDARCISGKMPRESLSLDFTCFEEGTVC
jgi:MoaA/NifB/PqqE/SkfB family radical SAM enzyme